MYAFGRRPERGTGNEQPSRARPPAGGQRGDPKNLRGSDENGTEAAAVTSVGAGGAERPEPSQDFIVDHPFVAVIRDDQTGAVLFVGQIVDP